MRRILFATNEPWGTYHLTPLAPALTRAGVELLHVVPDLERATLPPGLPPDGPLTLVDLPTAAAAGVRADLLVVTGATPWPGEVAAALPHLPVAASCLAYMPATPGPASHALRHRICAVTAASAGEADSFAQHLDLPAARERILTVGTPLLDGLLSRPARPRSTRTGVPRRVLVLTSVTRADDTGAAAPGTALLQHVADLLDDQGATIQVRLHPREAPALWSRFTPSPHPGLLQALAEVDLAVMIPGTAAPIAAAAGVPVVAISAPGLNVPPHVAAVCGVHLTEAEQSHAWVAAGAPVPSVTSRALHDAVGPVGGAADRLVTAWLNAAR